MYSSKLLSLSRLRLTVTSSVTPLSIPVLSSSPYCNIVLNSKPIRFSRSIQTTPMTPGLFGPPQDESLIKRVARKFGWTESSKSYLKACGYLMYIKVADEVNYLNFFNRKYNVHSFIFMSNYHDDGLDCRLEDTFVSWFTVMELHLWMLAARVMHEGEEGRIVRNSMLKALWEDCEAKTKKLDGAVASARKRQVQELGDQFQATLIAYDEGIQGNDTVMAGALWRRFLRNNEEQLKTNRSPEDLLQDAVALEMLVLYVRSQSYKLNELSKQQVLGRKFEWSPFDKTLFKLADKMSDKSIRKYA